MLFTNVDTPQDPQRASNADDLRNKRHGRNLTYLTKHNNDNFVTEPLAELNGTRTEQRQKPRWNPDGT